MFVHHVNYPDMYTAGLKILTKLSALCRRYENYLHYIAQLPNRGGVEKINSDYLKLKIV